MRNKKKKKKMQKAFQECVLPRSKSVKTTIGFHNFEKTDFRECILSQFNLVLHKKDIEWMSA